MISAGLASDAKMALARPREAFVPDLYEKAARAPASTGPKGREHLGAGRGVGVRGEGEGCLGPGRVVVWRPPSAKPIWRRLGIRQRGDDVVAPSDRRLKNQFYL